MKRATQRGKGQAKHGPSVRKPNRPETPGGSTKDASWSKTPIQKEVLFGVHPIEEMLRAGRRRCKTIWMARNQDHPRMTEVLRLAEANHIPIQTISMETLTKRCEDARHQGVAAEVSPFPFTGLEAVLVPGGAPRTGLFLALDSISDPQNMGAILRTAQCVGCEAVLLPKDRSARPTPAVSKASAGALEHSHLIQVTNLANTLNLFKKSGFWVAGTDVAGGDTLFNVDLTGPLVLVIGSEGKGMRPLVRQRCDFLLTIPQAGAIGSLNASAAAAVVMYEAYRQRLCLETGPGARR